MRFLLILTFTALAAMPGEAAHAQATSPGPGQTYPAKTVRIVVPFAPGGGVDVTARILAQKLMAGIDMLFVPYKGEGPAVPDAMGGQISLVFSNLPVALPQARAGKLRAIAITSPQRVATAPEFPTVAESGLPGYQAATWFGLLAPVATPREIIAKLNAESVNALNVPEVKDRMAPQGLFVVANTPEEFAAFLKTEIPRWAKVVKDAGVKPQ